MNEEVARSILRIIGVVTVLIGAIYTTQAVIGQMAMNQSLQASPAGMMLEATGAFGSFGSYAVLGQVMTIAFGLLLFYLSPALGRRVSA